MKKIIIIGGGASGVIAGISASREGNEVIIIEKNNKLLKKLLITGNGKCNYFNEDFEINHYYSSNIDILSNIINDNNKIRLLDFYDKLGIVPRIKNGYYYPFSNQSNSIYNILLKELEKNNVKVIYNTNVISVNKEQDKFVVMTDNEKFVGDALIISAGSNAYPKTGSVGDSYKFASSFNHLVNNLYPSLVSLKVSENIKDIEGVRANGKVSLIDNNNILKEQAGEIQFASYGISGICVFNLSGYVKDKNNLKLRINLLNDLNIFDIDDAYKFIEEESNKVSGTIKDVLYSFLNNKLGDYLLKINNIDSNIKWNKLDKKDKLAKSLIDLEFNVIGTNGYDMSQSEIGGVSLEEVDINTLESLKVKNLYFTGEALDVCGECGGYNLGFAFLSGLIAGESVNKND